MSKSNKELAVELTQTYIEGSMKRTMKNGTLIVSAPMIDVISAINLLNSFYSTLEKFDISSKD